MAQPLDGVLAGFYIGDVVFNKDPEDRGRLQVRVEEIYGTQKETADELLPWARPIMQGGGFHDGGSKLVPPIGSTVAIIFEQGSKRRPAYLGLHFIFIGLNFLVDEDSHGTLHQSTQPND